MRSYGQHRTQRRRDTNSATSSTPGPSDTTRSAGATKRSTSVQPLAAERLCSPDATATAVSRGLERIVEIERFLISHRTKNINMPT